MSYTKVGLGVSTLMMVVACSTMKTGVYDADEFKDATLSSNFVQQLQQEEWLANQFRIYETRKGYKAFATYSFDNHIVASGFSDNKLTLGLAKSEALRLCHAYAQVLVGCKIEAEAGTDRERIDYSTLPKEVIGYPDYEHYQDYLNRSGHKAIAGNLSGILGGGQAATEKKAQEEALAECYNNTHFSVPNCYIIQSE